MKFKKSIKRTLLDRFNIIFIDVFAHSQRGLILISNQGEHTITVWDIGSQPHTLPHQYTMNDLMRE